MNFSFQMEGMQLGMQNIEFFANILQLIWPIIETDINIYVLFPPHLIAEIM